MKGRASNENKHVRRDVLGSRDTVADVTSLDGVVASTVGSESGYKFGSTVREPPPKEIEEKMSALRYGRS